MTDSLFRSEAFNPRLTDREGGWFITYNETSVQVLLWLDETGHIVRERIEPLLIIEHVFPRGDLVYLVQYEWVWESVRLIAHAFESWGDRVGCDTFFTIELTEQHQAMNIASADQSGTLLAVVPIGYTPGDTTIVTGRIIRYEPGNVSASEPFEMFRMPHTDSTGCWIDPDAEFGPWGSGLLAYSCTDFSTTESLRLHGFGADDALHSTLELGSWDSVAEIWTCGIDILIANESVYACGVKASPNNPYQPAVYVEAFPLSEVLEAGGDFIPQPVGFGLSAYPNPFNAQASLSFSLPITGAVSLKLYDITGREVRTLLDERRAAGRHVIRFDASDLPSGVYLCRLSAADWHATQKLVLLK